ncbi:ATP-grasp domain-containing protein [Kitasatospora sp. NPDC101183]|uniref:ATP-grasp domain-containing protein n=1 Tax=Kitasatospora sp. NPDC101183 TaxID=3364100 RepID=UPI0038043625
MTTTSPGVLLLAPRVTETGHQLRTAAGRRGLRARTATSWRAPRELVGEPVHLYGGPLFADAVGRELGLGLLEPAADWLTRLPLALTRRQVSFTTLARARRRLKRPAFVKPPADKLFPARVHPHGSALPGPDVLPGDTPVLVSEVVRFGEEFRLFVLDGRVEASSLYSVNGDLRVAPLGGGKRESREVLAFTREVLAASAECAPLPSAAVVDVGLTDEGHWAVVEANAAWASGGYAADPEGALDVVLRSAGPASRLRPADRPFLRELPEVVD